MRILNLPLLESFQRRNAGSRGPLDAWRLEVERAAWRTPQEIRSTFRSADFLAGNRVIFNIKGNTLRLVVKVRFESGLVLIEWVGTHAEYDRIRF